METKFTLGPWAVHKECDGFGSQDWDEIVIGMGTYNESPFCYESHHKVSVSAEPDDEEGYANAHLISCAPEMYKLLESLSEMMPMLDEQTHPQIEMDAVKYDIDKLLAKARGEQCD
jgi:hypothetical protein